MSRNTVIAGQAGFSFAGFLFGQASRFGFNLLVARVFDADADDERVPVSVVVVEALTLALPVDERLALAVILVVAVQLAVAVCVAVTLTVEVLEGLQGGETLIVGPFKALRELKGGDPVRAEKRKKD